MNTRSLAIAALFATTLGVGGCASTQPTHFYLLQPTTVPQQPSLPTDVPTRVLGIGPIELPRYLDRPQIVTRGLGNRLEVAEFARWAEPLQDNVMRVLGENLARLLPVDRITRFPWKGVGALDYQVTVVISRFDGSLGADSLLIARWQVLAPGNGKTLVARQSSFSMPAHDAGHSGTVAAMNRALDALSQEIGEALRATDRAGVRPTAPLLAPRG